MTRITTCAAFYEADFHFFGPRNILQYGNESSFLVGKSKGLEFAKCLRSLGQFIQTVIGQNNFW